MTRAELYALVWREPVSRLAERHGISSARVRKICDDYNIPVPPPGYWTKLAHGKAVEPPPLPRLTPPLLKRINSILRRIGDVPLQLAEDQLNDFDLRLEVSGAGERQSGAVELGPVALRLERSLLDAVPAENGFVSCAAAGLPMVRVGSGSIARAVRLCNAFIVRAESAGCRATESNGGFRITAEAEEFALRVYETRDRRLDFGEPRPVGRPSAEDAVRHPSARLDRPSGRLCLEIVDPRPFKWSNANRVGLWFDRRGRAVEDCVDLAVASLAGAVALVGHARARANAERQAQEARQELLRAEHQISAEREQQSDREQAFLLRKAEELSSMHRLAELADYLEARARVDGRAGPAAMIRALRARVSDLKRGLEAGELDSEIRNLGLFSDEK